MATSKTFIPMVSASPPPLDGFEDDEEDDFGSFASAGFSPVKPNPVAANDACFFPIKEQPLDDEQHKEFGSFATFASTSRTGHLHTNGDDANHSSDSDLEFGTFPVVKKETESNDNDMSHAGCNAFHSFRNGADPNEEDNSWGEFTNSPHDKSAVITDNGIVTQNQTLSSIHATSKSSEDILSQGTRDNRETCDDLSRNSVNTNSTNSYSDDNTMDCHSPFTSDSHSQDTDSSDFQPSKNAQLPHSGMLDAKSHIGGTPKTVSHEKSINELPNVAVKEGGTGLQTVEAESVNDDFGDFSSMASVNAQEKPKQTVFVSSQTKDQSHQSSDSDSQRTKSATSHGDSRGDRSSISRSPEPPADDWGDFDVVPASAEEPTSTKSAVLNNNADDDDFSDFESFSEKPFSEGTNLNNSTSQTQGDSSFGGFGTFHTSSSWTQETNPTEPNQSLKQPVWATATPPPTSGISEDDFGDFGTFQEGSGTQAATPGPVGDFQAFSGSQMDIKSDSSRFSSAFDAVSASSSQAQSSRVDRVFKTCFPGNGSPLAASLVVDLLVDIVIGGRVQGGDRTTVSGTCRNGASGETDGGGTVWSCLRDLERTNALGYQWAKSGNSKQLLGSLGVDSRNILASKKAGMPIFAPNLGMLMPSKPGEKPESPSPSGGGPAAESPEGESGASTTPAGTPQDAVPKVEFDWSNSGLTNPLDANGLNLDIFSKDGSTPANHYVSKSKHKSGWFRRKAPSLDPELLKLEKSGPPQPLPAQKHHKPLDDILKSSAPSMVQQRSQRDAGLSSEANRVLDGLPSLSFMHAKVLMFPMRPLEGGTTAGSAPSHGSLL